jgi:hypothetical protein
MSTKLKLLGSDVASFGVNQPGPNDKCERGSFGMTLSIPQAHLQQGWYSLARWNLGRRHIRLNHLHVC